MGIIDKILYDGDSARLLALAGGVGVSAHVDVVAVEPAELDGVEVSVEFSTSGHTVWHSSSGRELRQALSGTRRFVVRGEGWSVAASQLFVAGGPARLCLLSAVGVSEDFVAAVRSCTDAQQALEDTERIWEGRTRPLTYDDFARLDAVLRRG